MALSRDGLQTIISWGFMGTWLFVCFLCVFFFSFFFFFLLFSPSSSPFLCMRL